MTAIHHSQHCGNSPKNKRVEEIAISIELGTQSPAASKTPPPRSITIVHAIAHGKVGAASGHTILHDGTTRRFAHILEFTSAACTTIASIETYR